MAQPKVKELRELLTRWHDLASKAGDDFQQAATMAAAGIEDKPTAGQPIGKSKQFQAGEHLGHATGLRRAMQELRELLDGKRPGRAPGEREE